MLSSSYLAELERSEGAPLALCLLTAEFYSVHWTSIAQLNKQLALHVAHRVDPRDSPDRTNPLPAGALYRKHIRVLSSPYPGASTPAPFLGLDFGLDLLRKISVVATESEKETNTIKTSFGTRPWGEIPKYDMGERERAKWPSAKNTRFARKKSPSGHMWRTFLGKDSAIKVLEAESLRSILISQSSNDLKVHWMILHAIPTTSQTCRVGPQ